MNKLKLSSLSKTILCCIFFFQLFGVQSQASDSLWNIWQDESVADTVRLKALKTFIRQDYLFTKPDSAAYFSNLQLQFANQTKNLVYKGDAFSSIGISWYLRGGLDSAIVYYQKGIEIFKEIDHQQGLSKTTMNLGNVYYFKGDYAQTIKYYTECLEAQERLKDTLGQAQVMSNIGTVNLMQDELTEAKSYFEKAIKLYKTTSDKVNLGTCINNLGLVFLDRKEFVTAKSKFTEALKISRQEGNQSGIAMAINNIGMVERELGNFDVAEENFNEAKSIYDALQDQKSLLTVRMGLGKIYVATGQKNTAVKTFEKCLADAQKIGYDLEIKNAAFELYNLYKANKPRASLEMHELYVEMRDSLEREENQQEVIRQKFKYEYEKQAVADSITNIEKEKVLQAELQAEKIEKKAQQTRNLFLWIGIAIVSLFGLFLYNRFKVTQKQKSIIEDQKEKVDIALKEVEEKNKEIMDSIVYAKRIQTAILPTEVGMKSMLPDSFVIYMPKDIVAGDFYWMEQNGGQSGQILAAVADCTGHGVPGAMVSVVCNNGLNRSVREHLLNEPGKILDKTREIVVEEFGKSSDKVNDGMDIALISIKDRKLKYAGANNPLWIIRDEKIIEIKANKQPIGNFDAPVPYETHEIQLQESDYVYIFTDGFVDQFGGEKGKKYKPASLRKILLAVQGKSMQEQKEIIIEEFNTWKGELEQVDDVCLLGIKIS